MQVKEAIHARRAIKHFDAGHKITAAEEKELLETTSFDIEEVAKLINLPDDHVMGPMVAIGKGTKDAWPKPGQLSLDEVVNENGFGA